MSLTQGAGFIMADSSGILVSRQQVRSNQSFDSCQIHNSLVFQSFSNYNNGQKTETPGNILGCANKICKNYNQSSKEQPQQISAETLCYRCKQQYLKDSFCIYCKQIYFDQTDDGKQWIMCEECSRWVHSQCADFNTKENPNAQFQCIKCKKIELAPNGRRNIVRAGYAKIEKKKNSQFLNSIGFEWQLATHEISQDMESIRKYLS